uniref:ATP synthase peripheral stalk subunit OSCP n=1 Tax=Ursus maritimus TaxID=29073 RepID=A0A452VCH9_URSMA
VMSIHRGEVPCTVTTASPLDEAILSELKTVLKSFLGQGQVSKLEVKIDLSSMGAMIVHTGEKYADMSVKTKIQKLSTGLCRRFSESAISKKSLPSPISRNISHMLFSKSFMVSGFAFKPLIHFELVFVYSVR